MKYIVEWLAGSKFLGSWELGVRSWELGVGSWIFLNGWLLGVGFGSWELALGVGSS